MSLEAKIEILTAAVERLTAVVQSAGIASHDAAAAAASLTGAVETGTKPRTPRTKKDTAATDGAASTGSPASTATDEASTATGTAAAAAVNDGKKVSVKLRTGDPEGTRYFHIEAHRTVAAIKPGEVIPTIGGMVEIDGEQYDKLKASYTVQVQSTTGNASAATPAANTPSASTASSSTSDAAATSPAIDGPTLVEKCKKLHARDGNEAIRKVLDQFKAAKVGELITKTAQLGEIAAFVDGLLNPPAATTAAAPDLF